MPHSQEHNPTERVGQRVIFNLAAFVIVLAGIHLASEVLIPLMLAAFIAVLTAPLISWLQRRRVPRLVGTIVAIALDVAFVIGLGVVIVTSVNSLYDELPRYQGKLLEWIDHGAVWLNGHGVAIKPRELQSVFDASSIVDLFGTLIASIATLVSNVMLILLIVAFLLFESAGIGDKLLFLLKRQWHHNSQEENPFSLAAHDIQKYLAVKTLTSLATGLLVGLWFTILGIDFALLWGVMAFLFNYIPNIGSFIAVTPPIFIAFIMQGPATAFATGLGSFIVNFIIGNIVEPRALGKALGLSPLIVLVSMVFWGWLLGPFGAIISVPLTMIVKIGLSHSDDMAWITILLKPPPKLSPSIMDLPKLSRRLTAISKEDAPKTEPTPDQSLTLDDPKA